MSGRAVVMPIFPWEVTGIEVMGIAIVAGTVRSRN
jgi:hypothetical protein